MHLDRNFVKNLSPSLAGLLPHGGIKTIAEKVGCQPLTARNAVHGASTNELVVKEALKALLLLDIGIRAVFEKIPMADIEKLREEVRLEALGAAT